MKVLIRGAGDLASGIACRLSRCGFSIVMTEQAVPTTVRRTVAFSRAVYQGEAGVEDVRAVLSHDLRETERIIGEGDIAVVVDEGGQTTREWKPDVLVDAILAKRNLGTRIADAPMVIGVGPGFTAGKDCHCVVETKRGHDLGRCIYEGGALPNTGVPGEIGGYSAERILRAPAGGRFRGAAAIGDTVRTGDLVGYAGDTPMYAAIDGVVRGLLQDGVTVFAGMKAGDVDPRAQVSHCFTVSDKARAVGGGVLEAILSLGTGAFERMGPVTAARAGAPVKGRSGPGTRGCAPGGERSAAVLLAAGQGSRFGGGKLLCQYGGKPLYRHVVDQTDLLGDGFVGRKLVVTGERQIMEDMAARGYEIIENTEPERGISHSIRLALEALRGEEACLFCVCDQPFLRASSLERLIRGFWESGKGMGCLCGHGAPGNPVIFHRKYFEELSSLTGDTGGKSVLNRHRQDVYYCETDAGELGDIDYREDLAKAERRL